MTGYSQRFGAGGVEPTGAPLRTISLRFRGGSDAATVLFPAMFSERLVVLATYDSLEDRDWSRPRMVVISDVTPGGMWYRMRLASTEFQSISMHFSGGHFRYLFGEVA